MYHYAISISTSIIHHHGNFTLLLSILLVVYLRQIHYQSLSPHRFQEPHSCINKTKTMIKSTQTHHVLPRLSKFYLPRVLLQPLLQLTLLWSIFSSQLVPGRCLDDCHSSVPPFSLLFLSLTSTLLIIGELEKIQN